MHPTKASSFSDASSSASVPKETREGVGKCRQWSLKLIENMTLVFGSHKA